MDTSPDRPDFNETCRFIETLSEAMQRYGISSRGMVQALSRIARGLGLHGEFLVTPNYVQSVLWDEANSQRVHLAVSRSGDYDLRKLARVQRLTLQVEQGELGPSAAFHELKTIENAPDAYGPGANAAAFVLCGVAFALIMGASWIDAAAGGILGLGSFGVTLVGQRWPAVGVLQELLAACLATFLGTAAAMLVPGLNPATAAICAVIWFVPGFGLTIAPSEILMGNTLSGLVWLANATMAALKLFGGFAMGLALAASAGLGASSVAPAGDMAAVWMWMASGVLVIALAVLMRVELQYLIAVWLGGWLVWGALQVGSQFGIWQGTFLAAALLVLYSQWYGNRYGVPGAITMLPGVMLLVPGLAALRALQAAEEQGVLAGFEAAYPVVILITAIVGGAIVGDAIAFSRLAKTGVAVLSVLDRTARRKRGRKTD